ncbi:MAG: MBL fold metallo-hydrolase [Candidatus Korarchaeota archaeon]|nr:MBL fold metallo-hydrolase [Candidatus Korarchaeota archaeon]
MSGLSGGTVDRLEVYVLAEEHASGMFWAQHGISFLLKVRSGEQVHEILFDTGNSWEPIEHNLRLLGQDVSRVKAVVLSHRHYDHTGGLRGLLTDLNREITIISHPDLFRPNFVLPLREIGIPFTREELEGLGARFLLTRDPIEIVSGVVTTGEIPRTSELEREMTIETYTVDVDGRLVRDPIMDDVSLIVKLRGGSVVLTGCSHAGVVNIVKRALEIAGPVRAVMGGFHLVSASEERIEATVRALRDLGVEQVITGHCTGLPAECAFRRPYGRGFAQLAVGKVFKFT